MTLQMTHLDPRSDPNVGRAHSLLLVEACGLCRCGAHNAEDDPAGCPDCRLVIAGALSSTSRVGLLPEHLRSMAHLDHARHSALVADCAECNSVEAVRGRIEAREQETRRLAAIFGEQRAAEMAEGSVAVTQHVDYVADLAAGIVDAAFEMGTLQDQDYSDVLALVHAGAQSQKGAK